MRSLLLFLSLAAVLVGCGFGTSANKRIDLAGASNVSAEDQAVIAKRLDDGGLLGFLNPTPSFTAPAGHLEIRLRAAPDADDDMRFLLSHQGRFEVRGEDGQVWVDQADIVEARPAMGQDGAPVLRIKLADAGAKRLAGLSSAAAAGLGETLVVKLDDETLSAPRVVGAITGGNLELPIKRKVGEVFLIARIILSGKLSFRPGDVRVSAMQAP